MQYIIISILLQRIINFYDSNENILLATHTGQYYTIDTNLNHHTRLYLYTFSANGSSRKIFCQKYNNILCVKGKADGTFDQLNITQNAAVLSHSIIEADVYYTKTNIE